MIFRSVSTSDVECWSKHYEFSNSWSTNRTKNWPNSRSWKRSMPESYCWDMDWFNSIEWSAEI